MEEELPKGEDNCIGEPFKEGYDPRRNYGGRPKETEETKLVRKAQKDLIKEYREKLTEALPLISPVLIAKALEGDLPAIKELNDRVMGKAKETVEMQGGLNIQFAPAFNKNVSTTQSTGENHPIPETL